MTIGKVQSSSIVQEMQRAYLDYSMSVIVSRALPDIRDGLKPVHRRILYAMHKIGLSHTSKFTKSAKVVGEVLGKYHPHGDMSVYDALVRMAQSFSMRYPLITGQGNFGSVDGDSPAAMRYTEVKLAPISQEILIDIEKQTVNWTDNFDATLKEPEFLPAKLPNLLLMGAEGIAVGMATKIPPHNLSEIIDALIYIIDRIPKNSPSMQIGADIATDELLKFIKGPDFPTAGTIYDWQQIKEVYHTGRGRIIIRGKAEIQDMERAKQAIIISELPYQVNKANLVAKIAHLVKEKKINGISDLRDESDRQGIRVVVELKKNSRPQAILNNLYKQTDLQTVFSANFVALIDKTPLTLSLKTILTEYLKHRQNVVRRRSEFELAQTKKRAHILEGLKIALDHINEVIETIKKAPHADAAKENLISKFKFTEIQATAILDMQLRRLAALERQKIEDELSMAKETIAYLENLLSHPEKILQVIKDELQKLKEKYGDQRKTKVHKARVGELTDSDLIPLEEMIIVVTESGYIKRISRGTFRTQRRGGKGVSGMTTKQEDEIAYLLSANTHDDILFFTNRGRVYKIKVWDIPEGSRQAKGQAVINLINIEQGEKIQSILPCKT